MHVAVQYVSIPYVALGYHDCAVDLRIVTYKGIDLLPTAARGTVRSYTLRVIGIQILELSVQRIEPLRTQR
jgi:hypothetical protein